jgi:hypothetical protein
VFGHCPGNLAIRLLKGKRSSLQRFENRPARGAKLNDFEAKKPVFGINKDLDLQERIIKKQLKELREKST